jgi:hypothetical protein
MLNEEIKERKEIEKPTLPGFTSGDQLTLIQCI